MLEKINRQRRRFLGITALTLATTQLGRFGSAIAQSNQTQPATRSMMKSATSMSFD